MKTFRLTLLAFASLLWASCAKELGPVIDFTVPVIDSPGADSTRLIDTTYEAAVETALPKRVLIEEFTGVTCTNCPAGHRKIKGMIDANPGRISVIGYQVFDIAQADPSAETRTDNRTQKATDLGSSFGGVLFLPSAAFNRTPEGGEFLRASPNWNAMLTNRLAESAPLNLTLATEYVDSSRELKVTVRMAYTAEVSTKHRLTIALTEDSVVDAQEEVTGSDIVTHHDYEHEHVFRDFITITTGQNVLDSIATKRPGRVYERAFRVKLNANWNAAHCRVIGFVHNEEGTQKNVLQVAEKAVKP